jgi:maltose alpha-D-glucosyltransferase/alpha-amylase
VGVRGAAFFPREKEELEIVLKAYLLEKSVYELGYELNNRSEWAIIP